MASTGPWDATTLCLIMFDDMMIWHTGMLLYFNKTENPSKDALDKADNYAKCKLCQLWSDWPGWLHDRDDQTNRSDQTDWGDQTEQGDQTVQWDQGDQTEQTEQVDQTDQTNIPTG